MDFVKTDKIDITPVYDMECARPHGDVIEDIHIVRFPMSNNDHCGDAPRRSRSV